MPSVPNVGYEPSRWVSWEEGGLKVHVQLGVGESGRVEVHGLYLVDRVTTDALRAIPIGRIEAWANQPRIHELVTKASDPGIDPAQAAFEQFLGARRPITNAEQVRPTRRSLKVRVPKGQRFPDSFYQEIASIYTELAAHGSRRPANEIAEANAKPVSTVHRWIKEARARGLLAHGQRGRAG